jgi:hypothetical protein
MSTFLTCIKCKLETKHHILSIIEKVYISDHLYLYLIVLSTIISSLFGWIKVEPTVLLLRSNSTPQVTITTY